MQELTLEEKRDIVTQRMHQCQRELYLNNLNEKLESSVPGQEDKAKYYREEAARAYAMYLLLEEELALLV